MFAQVIKNAATHSNLLRFKNISAACITCTTECTVVKRGLKFKCTWSKHRGWVVTALPLQHSILSDSNFYARYTYGNRAKRGIKLSHWNAGNAHLENKTIDIEHVVADHHPHLLGISEANLHRNHCIDNCRIEDYDLITCKTLDNVNLQVSRVVVYKHTSLVAKVTQCHEIN